MTARLLAKAADVAWTEKEEIANTLIGSTLGYADVCEDTSGLGDLRRRVAEALLLAATFAYRRASDRWIRLQVAADRARRDEDRMAIS